MHVSEEIVPVGVSNCGRCSRSCIHRTAIVSLSRAFHAFLTLLFFMTAPAHVMLAPIEGAILDFLFEWLNVLGRDTLPFLVLLLLTFVCRVFLILFLAALVTLFLIILLPESCELRLYRNDCLFFERLSAPLSSLYEQVVLVGGEKDELFMGEGSCSVGILIRFVLDVQSKKGARDHGVGSDKDVNRVVNSCAASDDLEVVGIEVGVKEFNVAFDCGAIRSNLPQIRA